ncbi:DUF2637 domain-containing protein [Streptomyces sp. NPDC008317]|uniref:DUF2637 domain-containing protein n=1 Tax=Streptomyces sp. NPDC008317 TaxID=3364827 RepID=UPI0036E41734
MAAIRLTRTHRILIGVVVTGAVVIAGIGFAGSYAAVRSLALDKGFGWFANVFPIGVDAGIVVLLALDLLLTWLRIPFPLLRQTAWLLTAATIAFNGAAAWPDPLGVGMHAIIPVLFVVSVEAARHAIGRIADITADKHMESVRITRWILAPLPTFRLWRRMKLWELRSYEETIRREQDRLVYRARLRARYGVAWRRKAPVEAIMPLRLAKYGVPLAETADAGLEAAGIEITRPAKELTAGPESAAPTAAEAAEPVTAAPSKAAANGTVNGAANGAVNGHVNGHALPNGVPDLAAEAAAALAEAARQQQSAQQNGLAGGQPGGQQAGQQDGRQFQPQSEFEHQQAYEQRQFEQFQQYQQYNQQPYPQEWPQQDTPGAHDSPWFAAAQLQAQREQQAFMAQQMQQAQQQGQQGQQQGQQGQQIQQQPEPEQPQIMVPAGPNRSRPLGGSGLNGSAAAAQQRFQQGPEPQYAAPEPEAVPAPEPEQPPAPEFVSGLEFPDGISQDEAFFGAYRRYVREFGTFPNARQFARYLSDMYTGTPPEERELVPSLRDLRYRFQSESDTEHIP